MAVEVRPQSPQTPVKLGWETALGSPDRCTCAKAGVPKSSAAEPIKENAAKANVHAHRPAITLIASASGVSCSEFQPRFRQDLGLDCPHRRQCLSSSRRPKNMTSGCA